MISRQGAQERTKLGCIRSGALLVALALIPACGGGGGGGQSPGPGLVPSFVIPGPGGLSIVAHGGSSAAAQGGKGGALVLQGQSGSGLYSRTGLLGVDTSFQVPSFPVDLGTNPLTVSGAMTLTPPGTFGLIPGSGPGPATGLHVLSGATLTINHDASGSVNTATFSMTNGILIESGGTLQMSLVAGSNDRVSLFVQCGVFSMVPGSSFLANGFPGGATPTGGAGGTLHVDASGDILMQGTIQAIGGASATGAGGNGGAVALTTGQKLFSTGAITVSGGATTAGGFLGGVGGAVSLSGQASGTLVSSPITSLGGDGAGGGSLGGTLMIPTTVGEVVLSGNVDLRGGNGTAAGASGGSGGSLGVQGTYTICCSGTWTLAGGTGLAPGGMGGIGGSAAVTQESKSGASVLIPSPLVEGGIAFSVGIDVSAGHGDGAGQPAGSVQVGQLTNGLDSTLAGMNPVYLVGYDLYDMSGGSGATAGGMGGTIQINNQQFTSGTPGLTFNGTTENSVNAITSGGAGGAGVGGDAGNLQVYAGVSATNSGNLVAAGGSGIDGGNGGALFVDNMDLLNAGTTLPDPGAWVNNSGNVAGNGGAGTGGNGGACATIRIVGHAQATNSGSLTSTGGSASGTNIGGAAQTSLVCADGNVFQTGTVTLIGGSAPGGFGGAGADFIVTSQHSSVTANVTLRGGDGSTSGPGGTAVFNSQLGTTVLHGIITLTQGAGTLPLAGRLIVDGVDLPLVGGIASF